MNRGLKMKELAFNSYNNSFRDISGGNVPESAGECCQPVHIIRAAHFY